MSLALLEAGADLNVRDDFGYGLLDAAAGTGKSDVIEFLLGKMTNININGLAKDGYATIHRVLAGRAPRYLYALKSLLKGGASPNTKSDQGLHPFGESKACSVTRSLWSYTFESMFSLTHQRRLLMYSAHEAC